MATREIRFGDYTERVELTDHQLQLARELLSSRLRPQIDAEFLAAQRESKRVVDEQLKILADNHNKRLGDARQVVEKLQVELSKITQEQSQANAAGAYGLAIQNNIKAAELRTDIMEAEVHLAAVTMAVTGERMNYTRNIVGGANAATVGGLDYKTFCNAARVIDSEWSEQMSKGDVANLLRDQARTSAYEFEEARLWTADAEEKLDKHRVEVQARATGGVVPAETRNQTELDFNKRWGISQPPTAANRPAVPAVPAKDPLEELRKYTGRDYSRR